MSALDAVVQVGDAVTLEDPGALELDVLGTEVVEETAPLAEGFDAPDEAMMALALDPGAEIPSGAIAYAAAFGV